MQFNVSISSCIRKVTACLPNRSLFAIIPLRGRAAEKKSSWLFEETRAHSSSRLSGKGFQDSEPPENLYNNCLFKAEWRVIS